MTVPAVFDVNVTLHDPATVPGLAQVLLEMLLMAPPESVSVTVGVVPSGAGPKPDTPSPPSAAESPSFCWTLTLNVWLSPMLLVSSGEMLMLASTNRLTTSPPFSP